MTAEDVVLMSDKMFLEVSSTYGTKKIGQFFRPIFCVYLMPVKEDRQYLRQ